MASAPSTLSRWAPGAKSAISPRCAAALAASPFWQHPGDGLEQAPLPVGRVRALPGGFDEARRGRGPRLALGLAAGEGLQVGGERGVGHRGRGDPVPQHRRGLGDQRRRRGVQRAAPGHAERVMHRRPDERVRGRPR
jgi:hypothetical protein